jgi:hypothetical protein
MPTTFHSGARGAIIGIGFAVVLAAVDVLPAAAKTCAAAPVSARGEPSRLLWIAKTQARANWRRKVRAMTGLGVAFENWKAAEEATERCIRTESTSYCIFTGIPCRA